MIRTMEHWATKLLIILGLIEACLGGGGNVVVYHGDHAPNYWNKISENCCGARQSPIDFKNNEVEQNSELGALKMDGYDKEYAAEHLTLKHNANTVEVAIPKDDEITISEGGLNGTYKLAQFHLHWGLNDYRGSEHTIDGAAYPAEIHFVHYNTQYKDVDEALEHEDGLAVLGVFIDVNSDQEDEHKGFESLHAALKKSKHPGDHAKINKPLSMGELLPENKDEFFRYSGSLTTPTCNEVVTWTVFNQPIVVNYKQMQYLREYLVWKEPSGEFGTHADNYRPVQPLNCRKVYKTFSGSAVLPRTTSSCSSHSC